MNVISALQAWDRAEFAREMTWQRNADVIQAILLAINQRTSPITIVKVKSHRGIDLNARADILAGAAAGADEDEVETLFTPDPEDADFEYTWTPLNADDAVCTNEKREVHKRWEEVCRETVRAQVKQDATFAGQLLTHDGWGQALLHQSRSVRPWTEMEERRWM